MRVQPLAGHEPQHNKARASLGHAVCAEPDQCD
jgi:hypothetical protein